MVSCGVTEHTAHTDDCLQCEEKYEHNHETDGCQLVCGLDPNHNHAISCYSGVGNKFEPDTSVVGTELSRISGNATNGYIGFKQTRQPFSTAWNNTTEPFIYINGTWYAYSGSISIGGTAAPNCGQVEGHVHKETCYNCGKVNHIHDDSCYKDELHTHTDACYTYPDCDGVFEHTHTNACLSECSLPEHTHDNSCHQDRSDNIIYTITAKYEATIGDIWPTADKFPDADLYGWNVNQNLNGTTYVSKRINMTSNLCDTDEGILYLYGSTGGETQYLYYMFESFDQSSPANGN